jgi:WD40 repeat protein
MTSLTDHVTSLTLNAYCVNALWLDQRALFAGQDGHLLLSEDLKPIDLDAGGVLCACGNGKNAVIGFENGRIMMLDQTGQTLVVHDKPIAWVDSVAIHPQNHTAFAHGKTVTYRDAMGSLKHWMAPTSVRGLSFAPKGCRLACAHYNGVSLWYPNTQTAPEMLDWKGSHIDVTWSPDGRFVISTMQENALHGWRLGTPPAHMRMTGYPAKTRSLSWSHDGLWLATSGADGAILWPFHSKEGPMGKSPRQCGIRSAKVTQVAFHPRLPILATGYEDGFILLIRLSDDAELLVAQSTGEAVTALAFDHAGGKMAFGRADGTCGILQLP